MSNFDRRALLAALQGDAARMGISVPELIKRITSGAQVIGAAQAREIPDAPTHMDTGEGRMPQIQDEQVGDTDDFEDIVIEREQALIDAGGDDLAREVIVTRRNRESARGDAMFTHSAPPSVVGAQLGGQGSAVTGAFGADGSQTGNLGAAPTVAMWQGDDIEARAVVCHFAPVGQLLSQAGGSIFRPVGICTFGGRGWSSMLEVDINRGVRFTVNASTVVLQIGMDFANPQAPMLLAGSLAFEPSVGGAELTRTRYVDTLGGGEVFFVVPPFARDVTYIPSSAAGGIGLNFYDSSQTKVGGIALAAGVLMTPVRLPGDVVRVGVTTTTGRLVFGLSVT